jgi:hypothetical protein
MTADADAVSRGHPPLADGRRSGGRDPHMALEPPS